ncbi:MAG TPA: hypothetical protein VHO50_12505, partial [Bacteroidales bacterium]|nr:hypothetical protein [Bacteroidales bacterium]
MLISLKFSGFKLNSLLISPEFSEKSEKKVKRIMFRTLKGWAQGAVYRAPGQLDLNAVNQDSGANESGLTPIIQG